jgi:hypothetical protein
MNERSATSSEDYKSTLAQKVTTGMIWAVLGTVIIFIAFAGWRSTQPGLAQLGPFGQVGTVELGVPQSGTEPQFLLLRGTIIAFDRVECPPTWEPFAPAAGRFLVGTGVPLVEIPGIPLEGRYLGEVGGEGEVVLTADQLAEHQHVTQLMTNSSQFAPWGSVPADGTVGYAENMHGTRQDRIITSPQGADTPHNNVPPFVAISYCVFNGVED